MKKIFFNILCYGFLAIIILIPFGLLLEDFLGVAAKIGGGSIISGIIITPFAIVGGINSFRGFCAVMTIDENKFGNRIRKGWQVSLYFLIYLGGYLAFYYAIAKCL